FLVAVEPPARPPLFPYTTLFRSFCGGEYHDAAMFRREALKPGQRIAGPALIIESHQTIVIEPGWGAEITAKDHVLLSRIEKKQRDRKSTRLNSSHVKISYAVFCL